VDDIITGIGDAATGVENFFKHPIDTTVAVGEDIKQKIMDLLNSAFDLTKIQDAVDNSLENIHFTVETDLVKRTDDAHKGENYKLDFRCTFKDTPARGDIHIKVQYLNQIFKSGLLGWDEINFKGTNYGFDFIESGSGGFTLKCGIKNNDLFNLIMTKPDHLFLCIDQSATYDANCNPFKWS
jgi:hypothetical protein